MNERLKNFPVSFFAVVMGLAGAAITWQSMESGFIKRIEMTGALDNLSRVLYYFGFFVFILMIPQLRMLARIKYYLSWWAYTFPLVCRDHACRDDTGGCHKQKNMRRGLKRLVADNQ